MNNAVKHSLYTGNGDTGLTKLPTDAKANVAKDDTAIEFLGTIEELNAYLGLLKAKLTLDSPALGEVATIQRQLFDIGMSISGDSLLDDSHTQQLEQWIDGKLALLPEQQGAILPGGDKTAAHAHVCRAISRRAERFAVALHRQSNLEPAILAYLNRLSDYFLVLARRINQRQGVCDNTITHAT